jgi:bacterioferritin
MEEYRIKLPYPELNLPRNAAWAAAMLDNFGGRKSEMSAVTSYVYRGIIGQNADAAGEARSKISKTMMALAQTEMQHLERFGDAARQLGASPRYWAEHGTGYAYWSPCPLNYTQNPADMVAASIAEEHIAIEKYTGQLHAIADKGLQMLLARVLLDEELHVRILEDLAGRV